LRSHLDLAFDEVEALVADFLDLLDGDVRPSQHLVAHVGVLGHAHLRCFGSALRFALLAFEQPDLDRLAIEHAPFLLGVLRWNAVAVVNYALFIRPLVERLAVGALGAHGDRSRAQQERGQRQMQLARNHL
jgi:hypothetical protein